MKTNYKTEYVSKFFKNNTLAFFACVVSVLALSATNLAVSYLMKILVDTISGAENALPLKISVLLSGGVILLVIAIEALDFFAKPKFIKRAMTQYKDYVFEKLSKKSIASFKNETTATYISALSNDSNTIEQNYLENIFNLISNAVGFIGAFAMMIYLSPQLTISVLILSSMPVLASLSAGNRMADAERAVSDKNKSFLETLTDALTGFSVIKSFKAEKEIFELFKKSNESAEESKAKKTKISTVIGAIGTVTGLIAQLGVFIIGAYLALTGKGVTAGTVLAFVNLMNLIISPIATIPGLLANRKSALALIDKLANSLEENVRDEGEDIDNILDEGIELKSFSFGYTPEQNILEDVEFTFEAGKSYAIVGASGSGKSTLLNALIASNDDYSGEILYDGVEQKNISTESLYDLVSIVQQNVFVFNASIRDNITMFRDFQKAEVDNAIKMSGLSEFIKTKGEDYLCGENGSGLSGGEKQRISIARSLLRKSSVLLVDEATASLDVKTAKQVSNSILDLNDITKIVVTHSLDEDILKRYDCILTLKDGKIIEKGSFDSLMDSKDYFYSLYTIAA